ncbi:HBL/NHE enterotoxin family protein [Bacillus sp. RB3]|uniref:non-hemolytic enterotoxin subunit A n=1 Tax=Bacillus sp. RB3 TaxID=3050012 RepID=UPI002542124F|nr:HBL/NHE enterotoxin family protein [Bacillus sp. RB3]MDK3015532.1 HBL/NHE enterotoxin family protein [Bacillus sp. RB3]
MKKSLVTGLLVTAILASPSNYVSAYAERVQSKSESTYVQNVKNANTLSHSIRTLGSQSPLAQAYGLIILQQPTIKGAGMSSLTNHQEFVKNHVREWLDEYNPKLVDLNQDMQRFSTRFNGYYGTLYDLAETVNTDAETKVSFVNAFNRLQQDVQTIQDNMNQTLLQLNRFNDLLLQDNKGFSEKAKIAIQSLEGSDGTVTQLRADIKRLQEEILVELAKILNRPNEVRNGVINIGKQVFTIAGGAAQTQTIDFISISSLGGGILDLFDSQTAASARIIEQKQKELLPLIQQLAENQIQVTEMTFIEDQMNGFTEMIKRQITTFEYLMNDWKALNDTMIQIQLNLSVGAHMDSVGLQNQLIQLKKFSDELYVQTKQFENFITNVTIN